MIIRNCQRLGIGFALIIGLAGPMTAAAGPFGRVPPSEGGTVEKSSETTVTTQNGSATRKRTVNRSANTTAETTTEGSSQTTTTSNTKSEETSPWLGSAWDTNYGGLVFYAQPKGNVCATYKYDAGRLTNCKMTATTVTGTWVESGAQTGKFSFTLTAGGKKFAGWWTSAGDSGKSEWKGTRTK